MDFFYSRKTLLLISMSMLWACLAFSQTAPSPSTTLKTNSIHQANDLQTPMGSKTVRIDTENENFSLETSQKDDSGFLYQFFHMLVSLGSIIVVILIASWFLKKLLHTRIQKINTHSLIKIVERRSLTPKTSIYILEVNGRHISIAESTNGVCLLNSSPVDSQNNVSDFEKVLNEKKS